MVKNKLGERYFGHETAKPFGVSLANGDSRLRGRREGRHAADGIGRDLRRDLRARAGRRNMRCIGMRR